MPEFNPLITDPSQEGHIGTRILPFLPHFATFDPLVHQIGLTLKAELEVGESSSLLYVESAATMLAAHLLRHYSAQKHNLYKERVRYLVADCNQLSITCTRI